MSSVNDTLLLSELAGVPHSWRHELVVSPASTINSKAFIIKWRMLLQTLLENLGVWLASARRTIHPNNKTC